MMQQWRQLRSNGNEHPNPRQQILDDLSKFIKPHIEKGNEVLLMMDANDPIDSKPLSEFLDDLDLYDLMASYLPSPTPTTYQRGRNKIDHIVGTMGILLAMVRAYIVPFGNDSPKSDHAICGIDFSLEVLSGITAASTHDPTHPASRILWSTDIKAAEKYIELVTARFDAQNIENRTTILTERCTRTKRCTEQDVCALNAIDAEITEIMLWAESKCKRAHGHAWSPLLANAG
jgi:hypothetical protein